MTLRSFCCFVLLASACARAAGDGATSPGAHGSGAGAAPLPPPRELVLERALTLEIEGDFEPSGLLFHQGHLLTISDKHDDTVFELILGTSSVDVRPFVRFEPPEDEPQPFDLEGLTEDADGSLLLASEARHRLLRVTTDGKASWATQSLQAVGARAGLFQKRNAGLEGIVRLPNGHLLLAAERDPRGLIELASLSELATAQVWTMQRTGHPSAAGRSLDFADLSVAADGGVYALERNLHLVTHLELGARGYTEREAWSYAKTEDDPRYAYEDREFGLAEGLALDATHVYVVFDNNNDRRRGTRDTRPLLFVFQRPR